VECGDVGAVGIGVVFAALCMMVALVDIGFGSDGREHERRVPTVVELERRGASGILRRRERRWTLKDVAFVAETEMKVIDVSGEMRFEFGDFGRDAAADR
jgi:hypothetical protein